MASEQEVDEAVDVQAVLARYRPNVFALAANSLRSIAERCDTAGMSELGKLRVMRHHARAVAKQQEQAQ